MANRPTVELESKSYSFSLGLVHRVFLNNTDEVKLGEEDNVNHEFLSKLLRDLNEQKNLDDQYNKQILYNLNQS